MIYILLNQNYQVEEEEFIYLIIIKVIFPDISYVLHIHTASALNVRRPDPISSPVFFIFCIFNPYISVIPFPAAVFSIVFRMTPVAFALRINVGIVILIIVA